MLLQGPSVSMDTACSSSLVAAHMACTSFLSAECPRALVAGINLTMRAETTAVLSKAGMLAQASSQPGAPHAVTPLSPRSCTIDARQSYHSGIWGRGEFTAGKSRC